MKCLNLGCGNDYKVSTDVYEWTNLDMGSCKKDVEWDIEKFPLPFKHGVFGYILAQHILEHINRENFPKLVEDLYRISADKCVWHVMVPSPLSDNYFTDFTHKNPMGTRIFDYFDDSKPLRENGIIYGYGHIHLNAQCTVVDNPPNGPDHHYQIIVDKS
jgi:hypothetical protein